MEGKQEKRASKFHEHDSIVSFLALTSFIFELRRAGIKVEASETPSKNERKTSRNNACEKLSHHLRTVSIPTVIKVIISFHSYKA